MNPGTIMVVAGDPSGDAIAADLVRALAAARPGARFFGAGGPRMAEAGVANDFDLTADAVIGVSDPLRKLPRFFRHRQQLARLAVEQKPELIILVDFSFFNHSLAHEIRRGANPFLTKAILAEPPSPRPSPTGAGEGESSSAHGKSGGGLSRTVQPTAKTLPQKLLLPGGEGRDEGEPLTKTDLRPICRQARPPWQPKIVKYVSPQVWASRPGRAAKMARDFDLLLCLFPFEKDWYAKRVPAFRVEFVGHPMFDRYPAPVRRPSQPPTVLLLPGSRRAELKRHLPVILEAARLIAARQPARFKLVAPGEELAALARPFLAGGGPEIEIQTGRLAEALSEATVAIASTGTVTLECAYFGVPTVALYKTSWWTYWIARQVVTVGYLSMPNILADEPLFPEFIQHEATPANIAGAALALLAEPARRAEIQGKLARVISTLGGPGAAQRAAAAILKMFAP